MRQNTLIQMVMFRIGLALNGIAELIMMDIAITEKGEKMIDERHLNGTTGESKSYTVTNNGNAYSTSRNLYYEQLQEQSDRDYVEVVRCKDCRYYHTNVFGNEIGIGKPYDCLIVGHCCCEFWGRKENGSMAQTAPEGFCSWGEKKDE